MPCRLFVVRPLVCMRHSVLLPHMQRPQCLHPLPPPLPLSLSNAVSPIISPLPESRHLHTANYSTSTPPPSHTPHAHRNPRQGSHRAGVSMPVSSNRQNMMNQWMIDFFELLHVSPPHSFVRFRLCSAASPPPFSSSCCCDCPGAEEERTGQYAACISKRAHRSVSSCARGTPSTS